MNQAGWEAHFQSLAASGRLRSDPDPRVKELVELYAPYGSARRVLDLACGAGANALWLAKGGWHVTAVDRSPAAIDLVKAEAKRRSLNITAHVADLEAHQFTIEPVAWDLIIMCRYLQTDLFHPALLGLAPGGLLIVIALLADPTGTDRRRFRIQIEELTSHFHDKHGSSIIHLARRVTSPDDFANRQATAEIVVDRNRDEV